MITPCHIMLLVAAPRTLFGYTTQLQPSFPDNLAKVSLLIRANYTANYLPSSTERSGKVKYKNNVLDDEEIASRQSQNKEQFAHRWTDNNGREAFDGLCDVQKIILENFSARGEKLLDTALVNTKSDINVEKSPLSDIPTDIPRQDSMDRKRQTIMGQHEKYDTLRNVQTSYLIKTESLSGRSGDAVSPLPHSRKGEVHE
ncbi:hypothetical protein E2C01_009658 [Portunus trituberculatus]|uniref:Uncharacterized protein n=1 Tax=Portunus trituberculatus TaxID=210409 RepID=A0A5B7D6C0_PORTR|nr:hypothetical protein [Portunus trituberculatus]